MNYHPLIGDTTSSRLYNLTPHAVTVKGETIAPSGTVARVSQVIEPFGQLVNGDNPIPVVTSTYGETVDLPAPTVGHWFIVSAMVRLANPTRKDLLSPSNLVRDDQGRIVGCNAFECNR